MIFHTFTAHWTSTLRSRKGTSRKAWRLAEHNICYSGCLHSYLMYTVSHLWQHELWIEKSIGHQFLKPLSQSWEKQILYSCNYIQWHSHDSCRHPQTYVKPEAAITVFELLMMSSVSLETWWEIKKHWNNEFYYMVPSCWLFL
jgi:hypothetical protein